MTSDRERGDVELLQHHLREVAEAIHRVMMAAYRVEADLIGAVDFVPLHRTVENVQSTPAEFLGIRAGDRIAAVAEIEEEDADHVHIGAVVVLPEFFRRGLATALLRHITTTHPQRLLTVSTGERNLPAIALYHRAGFEVIQHWTTADGIPMVTMGHGRADVQER